MFILIALDAFCLLEIFEHLNERLNSLQLMDNLTSYLHLHGGGGSASANNTTAKQANASSSSSSTVSSDSYSAAAASETNGASREEEKVFETLCVINETPIKPHELRVVCDNMLGGLGKELRLCGVDCLIIDNAQDHLEVARLARRENRFALSCGQPFINVTHE